MEKTDIKEIHNQKQNNAWKTTAIVFIILFILETLFFIYLIKLGTESLDKEEKCAVLCNKNRYTSFIYDRSTSGCSCFINGEEVFYEVLE